MSCCASTKSKGCPNLDRNKALLESLREEYATFIQADSVNGNGAQGTKGLGYDEAFLALCGFHQKDGIGNGNDHPASFPSFLTGSCGSGCPLRLLLSPSDELMTLSDQQQQKPLDPTLLSEIRLAALKSARASIDEGNNGKTSMPPCPLTVVDLGCGAGHDSILAAGLLAAAECDRARIVGVDVTEEMLEAARRYVDETLTNREDISKHNISSDFVCDAFDNTLDELQVAGQLQARMADIVMSNGVFNLTQDKRAAFATAFWLLKPGGKFLLADVCRVASRPDADSFFSPSGVQNKIW